MLGGSFSLGKGLLLYIVQQAGWKNNITAMPTATYVCTLFAQTQ